VNAGLQDPSTYADPAKALALNRRLTEVAAELEAATAAWAEKAAGLEGADPSKEA